MAQFIIMPRQGQSVESCIITAWEKKVGDKISKGDTIFSYETDKSTFDEVSEIDGTLLAILAEDGEDVPCLNNVCIIGEAGEDISAMTEGATTPATAAKTEAVAEIKADTAVPIATTATAAPGEKIKISPRAKALAVKTNADLAKAAPTGPNGRIIERDVNKLLDAGKTTAPAKLEAFLKNGVIVEEETTTAASPVSEKATAATAGSFTDFTEAKMSNVRRAISKAMHASLSEMAQLTLNSSFDATSIMDFRASLKSSGEILGLGNITINDMILYAVSRVLLSHKDVNANLVGGDTMRYFSHANIGIAVDTDRGLLVPTLFGADTMTLNELSSSAKKIINDAKSGSISPDALSGGTFTVTNLGSLGVESFTPVINPPQTAILGVCSITQKLTASGTQFPSMGLSLTFDHRAIDGAPAAKFLSDLCKTLENFNLILAK